MTYDHWKTTDPREDECALCGGSPRYLRPHSYICDDPECPCGIYRDPDEAYDRMRDEELAQ
jgi:hypothetical protein